MRILPFLAMLPGHDQATKLVASTGADLPPCDVDIPIARRHHDVRAFQQLVACALCDVLVASGASQAIGQTDQVDQPPKRWQSLR